MSNINSKWLNITDDLNMSTKKVTHVADGVDGKDAINKDQLETALADVTSELTVTELTGLEFGETTNSSIDSGAVNIQSGDDAADVVEEINSILGELVPPAAPDLDQISRAGSGTTGKLSFGSSHAISGYTNHPTIDINGTFNTTGDNSGIISASTNLSGTLNDDVPAHSYAYPANAFGNGDKGSLTLEVNGSVVQTVDLTSFGSGNSLNGNGSGFNLTVATAVQFSGGGTFSARKYRTGTWAVNNADLRNGYNTIQVKHSEGTLTTNTFVYIVDDNTTPTSYASEALSSLSMTGSNDISGITFHTGGSAAYAIIGSNIHRNTYSYASSAVSHPTTTNCSVASAALGNISTETETESISGKTVTVDSGRIIPSGYQSGSGNQLTVNTLIQRSIQGNVTSSGTTSYNLLVDTNSDNSSVLSQTFRGETRRYLTSSDFSSISLSPNYTSSSSLLTLTSELQCYNDRLVYPSYNFSGVANGPAGNPNYSTCTGSRYFYGYFTNTTGTANFRFTLSGSGLTLVDINTFSNSSAHVTLEIRLPSQTGWLDTMQAYQTGQWNDGDGCYSSSLGNDTTIPTTNLGVTVGTKSTANSGNRIYFRIQIASSATSGYLTGASVVWNAS